MSEGMPVSGLQMCTAGHTRAPTHSRSAFLVPLLCVICRLEMPRFRGQLAEWHHASENDIWEWMTSFGKRGWCPFPASASLPSPPQAQRLFRGRKMPLQQVVEGSQRQRVGGRGGQGCGVETAVWKQKSPLKSLDIMSSCPGPLPRLSLPIVEQQ